MKEYGIPMGLARVVGALAAVVCGVVNTGTERDSNALFRSTEYSLTCLEHSACVFQRDIFIV